VYAVGTGGNDCDFSGLLTNCDFLVRAYNPETGTLLWEGDGDVMGIDDVATGVAVDRGKVFASGFTVDADQWPDLLIRAYDADADHEDEDGDNDD
jgi:hypothetical protein